jgi:hypothetical protein
VVGDYTWYGNTTPQSLEYLLSAIQFTKIVKKEMIGLFAAFVKFDNSKAQAQKLNTINP